MGQERRRKGGSKLAHGNYGRMKSVKLPPVLVLTIGSLFHCCVFRVELVNRLRAEGIEGIKHECREKLFTWMHWAPYKVRIDACQRANAPVLNCLIYFCGSGLSKSLRLSAKKC